MVSLWKSASGFTPASIDVDVGRGQDAHASRHGGNGSLDGASSIAFLRESVGAASLLYEYDYQTRDATLDVSEENSGKGRRV